MVRVPSEVVERLKREVSVERLAEAKGIKLKGHGENLVGLCPFHDARQDVPHPGACGACPFAQDAHSYQGDFGTMDGPLPDDVGL